MIAEFLQLGHIVLSNGIEIHVGIHGRCDEDRCRRSHDRRRQHVVGNAVGDFANDVGRRRCDDEDVGPAGQGDVFYVEFRHIVEHGYGNGIAGNFPHRQGRDQFRRMVGHDAFDFGPPLAELAGNRSLLEAAMPPVIPKTIFFFSKLMENTSVLFNAVTRCFIRDLALVDFFHGNGNYFRRIDVDEGFVAIGKLAGPFGSQRNQLYLLSTLVIRDSRVGLINIVHLSYYLYNSFVWAMRWALRVTLHCSAFKIEAASSTALSKSSLTMT